MLARQAGMQTPVFGAHLTLAAVLFFCIILTEPPDQTQTADSDVGQAPELFSQVCMKIPHKSSKPAAVTQSNLLLSTADDAKCAKGLPPAPVRACIQSCQSDS